MHFCDYHFRHIILTAPSSGGEITDIRGLSYYFYLYHYETFYYIFIHFQKI